MTSQPPNSTGDDRTRRRAFMTTVLAAAGTLTGCARRRKRLRLACAAGWRGIVDLPAQQWARDNDTEVSTTYDGSGRLVAALNAGLPADVILFADKDYFRQVTGLPETFTLQAIAQQRARLVCRHDDVERITWAKVVAGQIRLSLADPETAAIGRVLTKALSPAVCSRLYASAITHRTSVTEVAADVASLSVADAGIIWDTTWPSDRRLQTVPASALIAATSEVAVGYRDSQCARSLAEAVSRSVAANAASTKDNPTMSKPDTGWRRQFLT